MQQHRLPLGVCTVVLDCCANVDHPSKLVDERPQAYDRPGRMPRECNLHSTGDSKVSFGDGEKSGNRSPKEKEIFKKMRRRVEVSVNVSHGDCCLLHVVGRRDSSSVHFSCLAFSHPRTCVQSVLYS